MTESHLLFHKAMSNMWKLQTNKRFKSKLCSSYSKMLFQRDRLIYLLGIAVISQLLHRDQLWVVP